MKSYIFIFSFEEIIDSFINIRYIYEKINLTDMKKVLIFSAMVTGLFLTSCSNGTESTATMTDSTATVVDTTACCETATDTVATDSVTVTETVTTTK